MSLSLCSRIRYEREYFHMYTFSFVKLRKLRVDLSIFKSYCTILIIMKIIFTLHTFRQQYFIIIW